MKKVLLVTSLLLLSSSFVFAKSEWKANKNELPMYGGIPFTAEEEQANRSLVDGITAMIDNKKAAVEEFLYQGWDAFYGTKPNIAMRRFNQCWLLDASNADVNLGFASTLFISGKQNESVEYLKKAATTNAASQNMLGLFYERGIGVEKDAVEAERLFREADGRHYDGMWKSLRGSPKQFSATISIDDYERAKGVSAHMTASSLVSKINNPGYQSFGVTDYIPELDMYANVENSVESPEAFLEQIKRRPTEKIKNGVWLIILHDEMHTQIDKEKFVQLTELLKKEGIPLFVCRVTQLPDGWQRVDNQN